NAPLQPRASQGSKVSLAEPPKSRWTSQQQRVACSPSARDRLPAPQNTTSRVVRLSRAFLRAPHPHDRTLHAPRARTRRQPCPSLRSASLAPEIATRLSSHRRARYTSIIASASRHRREARVAIHESSLKAGQIALDGGAYSGASLTNSSLESDNV